jgi:hypothetical protein
LFDFEVAIIIQQSSVADPDPLDPFVFGPLVKGQDPAPDPSIIKQK